MEIVGEHPDTYMVARPEIILWQNYRYVNINFDEEDYKEHKLEGPLSDRDKNRRIHKIFLDNRA